MPGGGAPIAAATKSGAGGGKAGAASHAVPFHQNSPPAGFGWMNAGLVGRTGPGGGGGGAGGAMGGGASAAG